jgi:RNA-binding protein YlmH
MTNERINELKRYIELSERSYNECRYLFTDFLTEDQISNLLEHEKELYPSGIRFFPAEKYATHVMVAFGCEENLGYEEDFPVDLIELAPKAEKFAEDLQHKDFLGALMNLGIERSAIGDLFVRDKKCVFYCKNTLTEMILNELVKARHTPIIARKIDTFPEGFAPTLVSGEATVQSLRLDSIVSRIFKISREEAKKRIQQETVAINGRFLPDPSKVPNVGDTLTVRGFGKAEFLGSTGETKRGRLKIHWNLYS